VNRNDPVLKRTLAALRMDDELTVRYQLDALQRHLDEIAAMVPHQPFADAEIRAARLVAHSIYQKLLAREWYEDVSRELSAYLERVGPESPSTDLGKEGGW
jgi:hypothetical protein